VYRELARGEPTQRGLVDVVVPCSAIAVSWVDTDIDRSERSPGPLFGGQKAPPSAVARDETAISASDDTGRAISVRDAPATDAMIYRLCQLHVRQPLIGGRCRGETGSIEDRLSAPLDADQQRVVNRSSLPRRTTPRPNSDSVLNSDGAALLRIELSQVDGWRRKVFVIL